MDVPGRTCRMAGSARCLLFARMTGFARTTFPPTGYEYPATQFRRVACGRRASRAPSLRGYKPTSTRGSCFAVTDLPSSCAILTRADDREQEPGHGRPDPDVEAIVTGRVRQRRRSHSSTSRAPPRALGGQFERVPISCHAGPPAPCQMKVAVGGHDRARASWSTP